MFTEFRSFIARGNVMDMAVGIIMGAAFTSIVRSLVDDIIMPISGLFMRGADFSGLYVNLSGGTYDSLEAARAAGAVTVNYGLFISAVISFLIVAVVVFFMVRAVNRLKKAAEDAPKSPTTPEPPKEVMLLTEIRDLLAATDKAPPGKGKGKG